MEANVEEGSGVCTRCGGAEPRGAAAGWKKRVPGACRGWRVVGAVCMASHHPAPMSADRTSSSSGPCSASKESWYRISPLTVPAARAEGRGGLATGGGVCAACAQTPWPLGVLQHSPPSSLPPNKYVRAGPSSHVASRHPQLSQRSAPCTFSARRPLLLLLLLLLLLQGVQVLLLHRRRESRRLPARLAHNLARLLQHLRCQLVGAALLQQGGRAREGRGVERDPAQPAAFPPPPPPCPPTHPTHPTHPSPPTSTSWSLKARAAGCSPSRNHGWLKISCNKAGRRGGGTHGRVLGAGRRLGHAHFAASSVHA